MSGTAYTEMKKAGFPKLGKSIILKMPKTEPEKKDVLFYLETFENIE